MLRQGRQRIQGQRASESVNGAGWAFVAKARSNRSSVDTARGWVTLGNVSGAKSGWDAGRTRFHIAWSGVTATWGSPMGFGGVPTIGLRPNI